MATNQKKLNPVTEAFLVPDQKPETPSTDGSEKDTVLRDVYSAVFDKENPITKARINDNQLDAYANAISYGETYGNTLIGKWIETRLQLSISLGGKSRQEATSIISSLMIPYAGVPQDDKPTIKARLLGGFNK